MQSNISVMNPATRLIISEEKSGPRLIQYNELTKIGINRPVVPIQIL